MFNTACSAKKNDIYSSLSPAVVKETFLTVNNKWKNALKEEVPPSVTLACSSLVQSFHRVSDASCPPLYNHCTL